MPGRRLAVCAWLACTALLYSACIQDDGRRWHPLRRYELISLDDEREIGMGFDRQVVKALRIVTDPQVNAFLNDLGQLIVDGIEPRTFVYRFRVVEDPQLNAFAVPGGYIYFHSGTILSATSLDELAGVMGHEIAHVKARHYAHRRREQQIRQAITTPALIAASVAAKQPGLLQTGMAVNVAMDLSFSRDDEAQADRLGAVYATRAGFDAGATALFFERILESRSLYADNVVPPYLFSHPAVEERIIEVRERSKTLEPVRPVDPELRARFRDAQARLAALIQQRRLEFPGEGTRRDHASNDRELARAKAQLEAGEASAALATLASISLRDDTDPRVPYRIGMILLDQGRLDGAIAALRRATELDSSHAKVFYHLGVAYKMNADPQRAVYNFEQAILRSSDNSRIHSMAEWEVVKLSFGVISESGFGDLTTTDVVERASSVQVQSIPRRQRTISWWGRISPPLLKKRDAIRVRWRSPSGRILMSDSAETHDRVYLVSRLDAPADEALEAGEWVVEVLLDDEVVHRDRARVTP